MKKNETEDVLLNAHSRIFDTLAARGSYLVYPDQQRGARNAPDPALFDLFLWNIIIGFFINLLASFVFEQTQRWRRRRKEQSEKPFTREQIVVLRKEIREALKEFLSSQKLTKVRSLDSKEILIPLLHSFGLPKAETSILAEQVDRALQEAVEEWAGKHTR